MSADFYLLLGVPHDATFDELKRAYRAQAKRCHPDLHRGSALKEAEFKALVNAFDVLSDPDRRHTYDSHRRLKGDWQRADAPLDREEGIAGRDLWPRTGPSVMDTMADDILEELIVGNSVPVGTSLQSLMRDLEHTERFLRFRETKNLYHERQYVRALRLARRCTVDCPDNILYAYHLGLCHIALGQYSQGRAAWNRCLAIGARRLPPQYLARVRRDLEAIGRKGSIFHRIGAFFSKPEPPPSIPIEEQMIAETSRAITRLIAKESRRRHRDEDDRPPPPKLTG